MGGGDGGEAGQQGSNSEAEGGGEGEDEKAFPQIFFFPSGEVSPVTLAMQSHDDLEQVQRWQISALGQITDPDREQDNDDQQDKQEWLERRSRMIEDVQE